MIISVGAYVRFPEIDYAVCCQSKYLLISWLPNSEWSSSELPTDNVPDNDYAALPFRCWCKDFDLYFEKYTTEELLMIEYDEVISQDITVNECIFISC